MILSAVTVTTLLWANWRNAYVWMVLGVTLAYGTIGFMDDYLKVTKQRTSHWFSGKIKLALELAVAGAATWFVMIKGAPGFSTSLTVPWGQAHDPVALRQARPDLLLAGERDGVRILRHLTGSVDFDFGNSPRHAITRLTAGLKWAPEIGPRIVISTNRMALVGIVLPSSAIAVFPADNFAAVMPEPTTVATSRPVPNASAARRRLKINVMMSPTSGYGHRSSVSSSTTRPGLFGCAFQPADFGKP